MANAASSGKKTTTGATVSVSQRFFASRWAQITLAVGAALTGFAVTVAVLRSDRIERQKFEERASNVASRIETNFVAPLEAVFAVDAFTRAAPNESAESFSKFARPLLERHPSLAALEWAEFVTDAERAGYESAVSRQRAAPWSIREPAGVGEFAPATQRPNYTVLRRLEPYVAMLDGLDVAFEPQRRRFLEMARARNDMVVTSKFRLVEDAEGVFSVAVYKPQFDSANRLHGLVIALFRLTPLAEASIRSAGGALGDVALVDDEPDLPTNRLLYVSRAGADAPDEGTLQFHKDIRFAGKRWTAVISAPHERKWMPAFVALALGLGFTAALALAIASVDSNRRLRHRIEHLQALGHYNLVRRIGVGGMGQVFEATHRLLRRRAAIKVIGNTDASADALARFEREARLTSQLTNPNTIVVFDFGRSKGGEFYYVMEFIDGLSLRQLVETHGTMPAERVRHVLLQVCGAVGEAHDLGFIHRDIKPANVMLSSRGGVHDHVKVLDFGLAKVVEGEHRSGHGDDSTPMGTPAYMSPEAFASPETVGPASDIYAIGVLAYFLLTGREPFMTESAVALVTAHLTQLPPPFDRSLGPDVLALEPVVRRCLEKSVEERFASAHQLAFALDAITLPSWTAREASKWWSHVSMKQRAAPVAALRTVELDFDE